MQSCCRREKRWDQTLLKGAVPLLLSACILLFLPCVSTCVTVYLAMLEQNLLKKTFFVVFSKICSDLADCFLPPKQLCKAKVTDLSQCLQGLAHENLPQVLFFLLQIAHFHCTTFSRGFFPYHCPLPLPS